MRVLIETYTCINHQISDNEVFEFKCSQGLLFDVSRQICDFKTNVDNCDVASGITIYIIHTINRIKASADLMSISTCKKTIECYTRNYYFHSKNHIVS